MQGAKKLPLSETNVGKAVMEILEDNVSAVIRHHQDMGVKDKPSEITVKIKMTPNKRRDQFDFSMSGGASLAPRMGAESTLFASVVGANKDVELTEFNPAQATMLDEIENQTKTDR